LSGLGTNKRAVLLLLVSCKIQRNFCCERPLFELHNHSAVAVAVDGLLLGLSPLSSFSFILNFWQGIHDHFHFLHSSSPPKTALHVFIDNVGGDGDKQAKQFGPTIVQWIVKYVELVAMQQLCHVIIFILPNNSRTQHESKEC
jgi:hypothetical protein